MSWTPIPEPIPQDHPILYFAQPHKVPPRYIYFPINKYLCSWVWTRFSMLQNPDFQSEINSTVLSLYNKNEVWHLRSCVLELGKCVRNLGALMQDGQQECSAQESRSFGRDKWLSHVQLFHSAGQHWKLQTNYLPLSRHRSFCAALLFPSATLRTRNTTFSITKQKWRLLHQLPYVNQQLQRVQNRQD